MSDFLKPLNRNRRVFFASIVIILIIGLVVISTFYRNFYSRHRIEQSFRTDGWGSIYMYMMECP
ncbi:hypothetical protein [Paenibacillus sp. Y412MC10]|uniref:hypothetical protein n=1 Tax=Geobacillus sp. (strain Y412MC10) TaxID=481743 RepID=UPI00119EF0FF|nr:hypothetical protein [Paenibacillus sp. Y412MC10]